MPVGPSGQAIAKLSPEKKEQLKAMLRKRLPQGRTAHHRYERFANAVKGRVPA